MALEGCATWNRATVEHTALESRPTGSRATWNRATVEHTALESRATGSRATWNRATGRGFGMGDADDERGGFSGGLYGAGADGGGSCADVERADGDLLERGDGAGELLAGEDARAEGEDADEGVELARDFGALGPAGDVVDGESDALGDFHGIGQVRVHHRVDECRADLGIECWVRRFVAGVGEHRGLDERLLGL